MKLFYFFRSVSLLLFLSGFFQAGYCETCAVDTTKWQDEDKFVIPYQENGLYGYRNSLTGEIIIKAKYERVYPCFHSMGLVKVNNKMGLLDLSDHYLIPPLYDTIGFPDTTFLSTMYIKVKQHGKWGLSDMENLILPIEYNEIRAFPNPEMRNYYCLVKKKDYWQLWMFRPYTENHLSTEFESIVCDSTKLKTDRSYLKEFSFKDNQYYPIKRDGKWGLLRPDFGRVDEILPPQFDSMPEFGYHNNSMYYGLVFKVKKNSKKGLFNDRGLTIFPAVYDEIVQFIPDSLLPRDNYFLKKNGKWGLYNLYKNFIIPPKFDSIIPFRPCPFNFEPFKYCFAKNQKGWKIFEFDQNLNSRSYNSSYIKFDRIIDTKFCCNDDYQPKSCFYPIRNNGKWGLLEAFTYNGSDFFFDEHFDADYDSISIAYSDHKTTFFRVDSSNKTKIISREFAEETKKNKTLWGYNWNATEFMDDFSMGLYNDEENPEFYFRIQNNGKRGVLAQSCLCSLIPMDSTIDNIYIEHSNGSLICWNFGGNGFKQIPVANKKTFEEYDSYTDSTLLFKNRIRVRDSKNDHYGIIDTTGRFIIPPLFDLISLLNDSALLVKKVFLYDDILTGSDDRNSIFYRLEKDGIMVFQEKNEFKYSISSIGKFGVMDFDGKMIAPLIFDVAMFDDRNEFLNQGGVLFRGVDDSTKIYGENYDLPWNDVKQFNGAVGLVHANDKWGMIDRSGKQLLATVYDRINFFDDEKDTTFWRSLVMAEKDQKKELYNYAGVNTLPLSFEEFEVVQGSNLALVTSNGKKGIFTNKGVELIPVIYDQIMVNEDSITINEDSTFSVWMNGKHGVVGINGLIIVPVK